MIKLVSIVKENQAAKEYILQRNKKTPHMVFYYVNDRTVGGISFKNEDGTDAVYHPPTFNNKVVDRGTKKFSNVNDGEQYLINMIEKHGIKISKVIDVNKTPSISLGSHEFDDPNDKI